MKRKPKMHRVPDAVRHSKAMRSIADHAAPQRRDRTKIGAFVMRGLDPRIHPLRKAAFPKKMDGRVKPGHDAVQPCYGPGSAAHHAANSGALRGVRGTINLHLAVGLPPHRSS
jgi:hypothetical protein